MSTKEKKASSMKARRRAGNIAAYIVLILMSIIWLFPFFGILMQSFRSYATEYGGVVSYIIPKQFSLDNYRFLFSGETNYLLWYRNTVIIAFCVSLLQTIIVLCVAYALSRMRFAGRTFLMRCWLILGMFPGFLTMICMYFLLKQFGLTQAGAVPGLILVTIGHDSSYNVAVGMTRWVWTNDYQGYFTRFCAGGVLVAIPVTLLFMALQKYYVEGVTGGAVKG